MAKEPERTTFRVSLDPARPELVRMRLDHPQQGRVLDTAVPGFELGLPATLSQVKAYGELVVRWPEAVRLEAEAAVQSCRLAPREPLWIELGRPAGLLPVVPWERFADKVDALADRPIYRLPYHPLPPLTPPGPRRLAICASSPAASAELPIDELVRRVAVTALAELPVGSEIHVFTDSETAALLDPPDGVVVHDPVAESGLWAEDERSGANSGAERWLEWLIGALGQRPTDGVHWIGHGYNSGSQGAFAIAESPGSNRDRVWARFVWAADLCRLLNRLGAWWLGITIAQPNYSAVGLRLLADQVAAMRPGPVVVHDLRDDPDTDGITAAYACLAASGRLGEARRRGLAFYCPPAWVEIPRAAAAEPDESQREERSRQRRSFGSRSARRVREQVTPSDLLDGSYDDQPKVRQPSRRSPDGQVGHLDEDLDQLGDLELASQEDVGAIADKASGAGTLAEPPPPTYDLLAGRAGSPVPWLATAQRVLEQSVSGLETSAGPVADRAARLRGVDQAYRFLHDVLAKKGDG